MSAMSASLPPAGLMPLSLISEHKTSVPAVQPIPRTPEKMNQQPPNVLQQAPQQVQQPLGMKLPAGVANGMEASQPPVPFPHQPQDSVHPPASLETSGSALPPTSHLPNLPSGSKGEGAGSAKVDSAAASVESNSSVAEPTPAPPAPEVPAIPEIRLPLAPGLTIMPIGIPMSQPSLPPAVPLSTAPVPVEPPQPPKEVPVTQVASVPPSVPEGAGNVAAARPVENPEGKPAPPERSVEKKPLSLPSEVVESTATPQAATPAPLSLVPPPIIKDAAQAPPPTPKPAAEPAKAPIAVPTPAQTPQPAQQPPAPAQPPVAPAKETPPAPPVEQAKPAAVAAQPPAATPAPTTAPAAQEAPASQPSQPAASQAASEPPTVAQAKPKRTPKPKPAPDAEKKTPVKETPSDKDGDGKPRRKRLPTQPYQSPIPELNLIAKINKIDKTPAKPQEDKLIVFYRNEFLAVRNPEGSFYVCQARQNIYKGSSKIKIRWLSQDPNGENYSPDFYDHTEFDCILTNLNLQRVGKDQFKLPEVEAKRTDSILKRAIDVEKGIVVADESTITEEHPDGLDLSLYRNEEQLKKRKKKPKKPSKTPKSDNRSDMSRRTKSAPEPSKKLPVRGRAAAAAAVAAAKRKVVPAPVTKRAAPPPAKKSSPAATPTATTTAKKEPVKKEAPVTPALKSAIKRKAPVAPASAPPADKRSRRDPTTKTKSGAVSASATGVSTPKPPASSSLRRPTRNSK
uniref:Uncharacterized protein n=2 Tax=Lygus hesperus TaxID=30085 RepID=A0A0K8SY37_LYGHE